MAKTQPIQRMDLTIGPAAVLSLAADLRQPSVAAGEEHASSQFRKRPVEPMRAPRGRARLYVVAVTGQTAH